MAGQYAGVTQLVECQPSKLNVEGSSPFARFATRVQLDWRMLPVVTSAESLQSWQSIPNATPQGEKCRADVVNKNTL